ncbi:hypothetical protein [Sinomonas sp. ASV322]|uniref:hypothetical protein n=1 Tax=Sinomonas sp. ASV322 TaxID=3041920 RepID=UPI0027DD6344|nr:hypothetical protein [Sinomonas sp. ASV322]MDQ4501768.1 hypothetical protein [Sinomonas sp. ASV322]
MEPEEIRSRVETCWPARAVAPTSELVRAGIGDRLLTGAVRGGSVIRLCRGAYILGRAWRAATPWEQSLYRLDAHAASTSGRTIYSYASAARLLGCSTWNVGEKVHVTVPYSSSSRSHGPDVAAHVGSVGDTDLVELVREGRVLRLTSLNRTVADCARILDFERASVIGDHALRLGATVDGIAEAARRTGATRGSRRIERLLPVLDARSESAGETRTRLLLAGTSLARPELQFEVYTEEGIYRADFAWPKLRVILEFDGDVKYFNYRPTPDVLLAERRRENALLAAGWVVVRIRWADLAVPGMVLAKLRAAFARAAKLAG